MNRLAMMAAALSLMAASVHAGPPGILDGENIPSDFAASKLVGVQTNYTGVGDVTSLTTIPVFTEGSELDALYLARDSTYLYIGLAGNLIENGSPFVILIDNPFEFGQQELRTEGVGGPAFVLQLAGREVVVDDNGTPSDGTDDTYTVVSNSGLLLPNCGDPGFTGWDFALAIDAADNGQMYVHEYILYGFQIGTASALDLCNFGAGRVSCDPTPDNPNDPDLPIYAIRNLVASSPLGDGNEVFEGGQPAFGYQRGGFDDSNTAGVTDTDASGAATATTGVEIAIRLANIGDGGLFGDEEINVLVLTMDGDEYQTSPLSDGYGTVLNQALPSFSGASCDPPQGLGMRPNLSVVASCLTVDLSTLGFVDTGAVLDGAIDPADYATGAPLLLQQCPTSGGDRQQLDDLVVPDQNGSELDAFYVDHDETFMYLGLTGNLQAGGTSLNVFIDVDAGGGDFMVSDFSNFSLGGTYEQWDTATFTSGATDFRVQATDFGGGWYDINPNLNARGVTTITLDFTADPNNQADIARVVLADGDGTERFYDFGVPGPGKYSLSLPLSAYSLEPAAGTEPGLDTASLSFFHLAGGFNNGDPGLPFDITFDRLSLSDDDEGQHVLSFTPGPEAYTTTTIEDFGNFELGGTYVSWDSATFTPTGTNFTVQTTGGFGGGWFDISPNANLASALTFELEVTVNAGSTAPGGVILVLADSDDTQLRWSFYGLTAGTHVLTGSLADGVEVLAGAVPGFDYSDVSAAHLQTDFTTTDLTFEMLDVIGVLPGVAPILSMNGNQLANSPLDLLGNGLFPSDTQVQYDYAYGINLSYAPHLAYVDYFDLLNSSFAFRGAVVPDGGDSVLFDDPGGQVADNPFGLQLAINNWNTGGIIGCDIQSPCFQDPAATVASLALQATSGVELAIPLAELGLTAGDLPRVIHVWTMVGTRQGAASNQSLPSMRNVSFEGNQVVNGGPAPVNFTNHAGGPSLDVTVTDFADFDPNGLYGAWTDATTTAGPDDFRLEDTSCRGGGYYILDAPVDAEGATQLVLDVTMNAANQTDTIVIVLFDGDGTVHKYLFDGIPLVGPVTLTKDLTEVFNVEAPGAVPGLDLANIGQFNFEGTWAVDTYFDVTFERLALVGSARNYEARAARICLSTIVGDGDCDGDNDMVDIALLQQCFGNTADPVFPMECEQLDVAKDGTIDATDFADLELLLTGP